MAPRPTAAAVEVHHEVPRCLLLLHDRANAYPEPLSGEGLQLWLYCEYEALRYGTAWFSLLARRRWEQVGEDVPAGVFGALARGGRSQ